MENSIQQLIIDFCRIHVLLTRPICDDLSNHDLDSIVNFIKQYKNYDFTPIIEKEPWKDNLVRLKYIVNKINEPDFKVILAIMTERLKRKKNNLERKCKEAKDRCDVWAKEDESVLQYYQNKLKECNEIYTEAIEKWNGFDANQILDIKSIYHRLSKNLEKLKWNQIKYRPIEEPKRNRLLIIVKKIFLMLHIPNIEVIAQHIREK